MVLVVFGIPFTLLGLPLGLNCFTPRVQVVPTSLTEERAPSYSLERLEPLRKDQTGLQLARADILADNIASVAAVRPVCYPGILVLLQDVFNMRVDEVFFREEDTKMQMCQTCERFQGGGEGELYRCKARL